MFSYFQKIKKGNEAAKQRFVVVATAVSFVAIVAVWVPIRLVQWRAPSKVTAQSESTPAPKAAEPSPVVAGDAVEKLFNPPSVVPADLPFITPNATVLPTISPEIPSPSVVPSDYPTL